MSALRPLKIYMITGETSGDTLGASVLDTFVANDIEFEVGGLAGPRMEALGAKSLFDITELSIMGFTEVIGKLPKIMGLVKRVVRDIKTFNPDVILLIDSPDFNYAVAKRIKKTHPDIPIIKYICPSVWAWRQGRAKKMTAYIDHVLAVLPFEVELMKELGGPETSYVGHPLARELANKVGDIRKIPSSPPMLLLLPGSRKGEVKRLLPIIRDTVEIMTARSQQFEAVLPAVDGLAEYIKDQVKDWKVKPKIVVGKEAKDKAFENADFALACSGTVMLELGLYAIPTISIYKLDKLGFVVRMLVKTWTACLPNLITDKMLIPEYFEEYANPKILARLLDELGREGPSRNAQLEGFQQLRDIMRKDSKSHILVASKILEIVGREKILAP